MKVTGVTTSTITGYFEVTVAGAVVHSKKNGDGFVDNKAKMKKIVDAVKARQ